MIKLSSEIKPDAKPAIVKIILPNTWKKRLHPDPQGGWTKTAKVCKCVIPSKYVKEISELKGDQTEYV